MNSMTREALWERLRDGALVEGALPERGEARSPWFVRAMLGFSGWIGALFLFMFVGAFFTFAMENAFAAIGIGAGACAAAALLFRSGRKGDFSAQFAFAVSLAGQGLMLYGLGKWFGKEIWLTALAMAAVQAALFALVPNFLHRVWAAWTGAAALAFVLSDLRLYTLAPPLVTAAFVWAWIREFDFGARAAQLRAAGYGLALASMQVTLMHGDLWVRWFVGRDSGPLGGWIGYWLGAALSAAVLVWAVLALLRREGVALGSGPGRIALAGAALLGLASLKASGVGPAAALLVVGYANGNRVLAGLGIVALLGYLSHYYYSLQATLLEKSAILAATGVALLVARAALHLWWPKQTEAGDA
ncbi:MAG: DUF4401 domain-containing protein [Betaproteobacteria bacterium]|nr:DUF4401 domain-containing protein [Betaproteobacteria bacterium]